MSDAVAFNPETYSQAFVKVMADAIGMQNQKAVPYKGYEIHVPSGWISEPVKVSDYPFRSPKVKGSCPDSLPDQPEWLDGNDYTTSVLQYRLTDADYRAMSHALVLQALIDAGFDMSYKWTVQGEPNSLDHIYRQVQYSVGFPYTDVAAQPEVVVKKKVDVKPKPRKVFLD